jgi:hypothetical protein
MGTHIEEINNIASSRIKDNIEYFLSSGNEKRIK